MATINELTVDQFRSLVEGYFAKPDDRSKMSDEEIKDLAKRLNKKINVPIISETGEEKILIKIVMKIDRFLYDNLPNEFYELVRSADQGIDDDEAKRLIVRLSKLANQHVDIPYIPEQMEYIAIRFIITTIINAARKQWDIKKAQNASDQELDAVVLQV
ncbi:MAG: hypothetical protein H8E14_12350 [Candidatus Marinimicrobia bacterium]|nr:hypothetical protein [Candidatus Neomarinimicrobiota bacterium]